MNNVVVTGISVVSPLNPDGAISVFWDSICSGMNAVRQSPPQIKGYPYNVAAWIDRDFSGVTNKATVIAEEAFLLGINDAAIDFDSTDRSRTGIIVGTVLGDILAGQAYLKQKLSGIRGNEAGRLLKTYPLSSIEAHLERLSAVRGTCITVSTACSSGNDAIGIAFRKIYSGKADVMVAGGVDVLSDFAFSGFSALQAMTMDKVRPFDKNRTGLALGEGAAFIILENERHAMSRKARIYGRISGYAARSDASHLTGPQKEGRGLSEAIDGVMKEAAIKPSGIDYINAHGTGTAYNDLMETKAVKLSMGNSAYKIPMSSIKSMLGHSFGAAGAIEAVSCILSMKHGIIPPTINYETSDPECDLDYTPNTARKLSVKTAISISAGFGGQNSAIVFARD